MNADMKEIVDRESMHAMLYYSGIETLYKGHNRKVSNRRKKVHKYLYTYINVA